MKKNVDISELISFSFGQSIKDKTLLKYLGILFVIETVTALIMFSIMSNFFSVLTQTANATPQLIATSMLGLYLAFTPIAIISILISIAMTYLIIARGLEISKLKSIPISIERYVLYIIFHIALVIWASLSLFNLKMLLIGIFGIVLFIGGISLMFINGIAGGILIIIGMLLLGIYGIVIIYNFLRLFVGEVSFIESKKGIIASLKTSWDLTEGNVLIIILSLIVLIVVFIVISTIATLPSTIYSFSLIFSQIGQGTVTPITGFAFFADPLYHIILLPAYVVSAYTTIVSNVFLVKLFKMLKN